MRFTITVGKLFLCSFLFTLFPKNCDFSGRLGIRLISYEDYHGRDKDGNCCDGFLQNSTTLCKPCDHFIFSCILNARDHGKGPCVSNNFTTQTQNDSNSIVFSNRTGRFANPFVLTFNLSSMVVPILSFDIYDDDTYDSVVSGSDLLEKTSYVIYQATPTSFNLTPELHVSNVTSNQSRLVFEYWFQCDQYYYSSRYTSECDAFCKPDPLRYECSNSGSRQCKKEWTGSDCLTYNYCFNVSCLHGGQCLNGATGFTCKCDTKYTGTMCETLVTSTTATSKQMYSKIPPTTRTVSSSNPSTLSNSALSTTTLTTKLSSSLSTRSSRNMLTSYTTAQVSLMNTTRTSTRGVMNLIISPITVIIRPVTTSVKGESVTSSRKRAGSEKLAEKNKEDEITFPKDVLIFLAAAAGGITLVGAVAYIVVRYKKNQIRNTEVQDASIPKPDW